MLAASLALVSLRPRLVVDHAAVVLALTLLVSVASVASLIRLDPIGFTIGVDPASEPLIRRSDPSIPAYQQALLDFGSDDVYVVLMIADDVFSEDELASLQRLTHQIRRLPRVVSAESLARVTSIEYDAERDLVRTDRLMDDLPGDAAARADLRARVLAHPIYTKTLVSRDGRSAAINVTFQPMTDTEFVALELDERITALVDAERTPNRSFALAGRPHVRAQSHHLMVGDIVRLVPVAVLIAACALGLMGGVLWGVLVPLLACLTATLWVFGAMATLGIDINLITLVTGPMMICIGSVYGVHVHARYALIEQAHGDARAAAVACVEYARVPVVLAGFTTLIGFAALLLADIPAVNELGTFSMLGVAAVTLISLSSVPAGLHLLARTGRLAAEHPSRLSLAFGAALGGGLEVWGRFVVRHAGAVLALWALLVTVAVFAIPRTVVDTDFISFFLTDSHVRRDFDTVGERLTGVVPIYVTVSGGEEGTLRDPVVLRALEDLQADLARVPGVSEVLSAVDFVRVGYRASMNDDPEAERVPDSRAAIAETLFVIPKSTMRRFATSNHSRGNLIVRVGVSGSAAVREVEAGLRQVIAGHAMPGGLHVEPLGNVLLINRSADGSARNQTTQVGMATLAIVILIAAVFRSVRVALIAIVPNVVPVLLFFGLLGLGAAPLSLPTSLIGSIALGIAIDDTMHFTVAYLRHRGGGAGPESSARACIGEVGRPIVMTSIMLIVGFLVIVTSGFATLREFGVLTATTMAICLATDLTLYPALLVRARV